jgi:hypothetical protein
MIIIIDILIDLTSLYYNIAPKLGYNYIYFFGINSKNIHKIDL